MLFRSNGTSEKKDRILTVLDVGSGKIACFIAQIIAKNNSDALLVRDSEVKILGYGVCRSTGIKSGLISNMLEAETAIKFAVSEAEKAADIEVKSVLVGINSAHIKSRSIMVDMNLDNKVVDREILASLMQQLPVDNKEITLHSLPVEYRLDESLAIENPIDMIGKKISAKIQRLSLDCAAYKNLKRCIQRCYLDVEAVIASPFASALAVLLEQEMTLGSICIDIGAKATSCAVFVKNRLIYAFTVACGSDHITMDIEHSLGLSLEEAEKQKCLAGFIDTNIKERNLISVISARAEEILLLIEKRLKKFDKNFITGKTVVLTGGGSYLGGYTELAEKIFKTKVRLGRPLGFSNMKELANSAAYSTALGMLLYPSYIEYPAPLRLKNIQKYLSYCKSFLGLDKKIVK